MIREKVEIEFINPESAAALRAAFSPEAAP
jgi:hypothetical protein